MERELSIGPGETRMLWFNQTNGLKYFVEVHNKDDRNVSKIKIKIHGQPTHILKRYKEEDSNDSQSDDEKQHHGGDSDDSQSDAEKQHSDFESV